MSLNEDMISMLLLAACIVALLTAPFIVLFGGIAVVAAPAAPATLLFWLPWLPIPWLLQMSRPLHTSNAQYLFRRNIFNFPYLLIWSLLLPYHRLALGSSWKRCCLGLGPWRGFLCHMKQRFDSVNPAEFPSCGPNSGPYQLAEEIHTSQGDVQVRASWHWWRCEGQRCFRI